MTELRVTFAGAFLGIESGGAWGRVPIGGIERKTGAKKERSEERGRGDGMQLSRITYTVQ